MKPLVAAALALAALGLLWMWVIQPTSRSAMSADRAGAQPGAGSSAAGGSRSAGERAALGTSGSGQEREHEALARSLRGTDVDGHLAADQHGNLVLHLSVRDFFDYFLSTVGEVPLAEVVAFMEKYARARLPAKAADQLMALLDDYMSYRQAAAQLYQQPLADPSLQTPEYYLETLEQTFTRLRELRRSHMSEDAVTAFFGMEEEYGQYTLDRMAIQLDGHLSMDERDQQLADLRSGLPEELRQSEDTRLAQAEQAHLVQDIMESGADTSETRAALAQHFPEEHVDRVVEHAESKRAFGERMEAYLVARSALLAAPPTPERERQLQALRQQHFPGQQEQVWARTYEARADRQAAGAP